MATSILFPQRPVEYSFTNTAQVTITHNKGYIPEVQIVLSDGTIVQGDVRHINLYELVVTFAKSISGAIYIR